MIYEEMYHFLMKHVSAKEFDLCLHALLHLDWDGHVRTTAKRIAQNIDSTAKYIRHLLKKFKSHKKGRRVLVERQTPQGALWRLDIVRPHYVGFRPEVDRYCKKYDFFYTEAFRNLTIDAKRLLLAGAFTMSVSGYETVSVPLSEFVPSAGKDVVHPFSKQRVLTAVDVIRSSRLSDVVHVGYAMHRMTQEPVVTFCFRTGTLESFQENHTERRLLRERLFRAGCQVYVNDDICAEIEKVGIHIYRSLLDLLKEKNQKEGLLCDADKIVETARTLYDRSVDKLGRSLNRKLAHMEEVTEVSAYFSAIVYETAMEEAVMLRHREESIERVRMQARVRLNVQDAFSLHEEALRPMTERMEEAKKEAEILEAWCEKWVQARVKTYHTTGQPITEEGKAYLTSLKEKVNGVCRTLLQRAKEEGNRILQDDERVSAVRRIKERVTSYFAILLDERKHEKEKPQPLKRQDMEMTDLPY